MTDWNMPPGCRVSDIPGVFAEDDDAEELRDALDSEKSYSGDLESKLDSIRNELRQLIKEIDELIGEEKK